MTPQEALQNPPISFAPPQPEEYELRVIAWEMKDVQPRDDMPLTGKMSDVFVSVSPEGLKPLKTDIHWRSKGDASFNWRMKWNITLPTKKSNRLRVQVWDKDILDPNDAICECVLNLQGFYKKMIKEKISLPSKSNLKTMGGDGSSKLSQCARKNIVECSTVR